VFVENFKVGDMARYGLDYASLRALNPRLVYCSVTGFGQTGPYKRTRRLRLRHPGHGRPDERHWRARRLGGGPQKVGVAVADLFTGMYATVAILAALRHAERTGKASMWTWPCSTPRWPCWPTWAPTTWSAARRRGARQCTPEHRALPGL
jgi:crotonobetainyl-CoA:carnitine CoA-transferase CaiB-like acyl-CoA transferase